MTDSTAIKTGRRHSASDTAVMRAIKDDTFDFAAKMSDYLKALGFEDEDGDGEVTPGEAAEQMDEEDDAPAVKALDLATRCEMVEHAIHEALEEVGLLAKEADDGDHGGMGPALREIAGDDDDEADIYVYDKYAVACLGGADWQVPYTIEAGGVVLGDPNAWKRVEKEWKPVPGAEGIVGGAVKMLDDGETLIAPAIRYGAPDEADMSAFADYFTKATDFWLGQWDRRPMLYHHAMDEGTKDAPVIGTWVKAWADDAGVWLEGQLDKAHKYHAAIKELARRGLLRISTDSAPHLVVRERQANGAHEVKRWPILAASLTVSPAEPRLLPAELKAYLADLGLTIDTPEPEANEPTTHRPDGAKASEDRARALRARLSLIRIKETP